MFTVAPSGSTKLDTLFDTPTLSSTQSIVTGSVADEEAVENAVSIACATPRIVLYGRTRPTNLSNSGSVMNACTRSAANTTIANTASGPVAL
jgi:hypothetical protein